MHPILNAASRFMRNTQREMARRRTSAVLHGLPDHILRDIGVSRSEINSLAAFEGGDASRRRRNG